VLSKIENPGVAQASDWAFVEEGQPIPTNAPSGSSTARSASNALYFGNGYMIHGTLYERPLLRPERHPARHPGGRDESAQGLGMVPVARPSS